MKLSHSRSVQPHGQCTSHCRRTQGNGSRYGHVQPRTSRASAGRAVTKLQVAIVQRERELDVAVNAVGLSLPGSEAQKKAERNVRQTKERLKGSQEQFTQVRRNYERRRTQELQPAQADQASLCRPFDRLCPAAVWLMPSGCCCTCLGSR
jgi:hypothetical protein